MGLLVSFAAKTALNGLALYIAQIYFPGFVITGGLPALVIASAMLALLNSILRPILQIVAAPLIWITFGLFNLVINMAILWLADQFLTQLAVSDVYTLFWVSILIALANAFF